MFASSPNSPSVIVLRGVWPLGADKVLWAEPSWQRSVYLYKRPRGPAQWWCSPLLCWKPYGRPGFGSPINLYTLDVCKCVPIVLAGWESWGEDCRDLIKGTSLSHETNKQTNKRPTGAWLSLLPRENTTKRHHDRSRTQALTRHWIGRCLDLDFSADKTISRKFLVFINDLV